MQVVIIGTGNVATVLGRKIKQAGHTIAQVYGRSPQAAAALAAELMAAPITDITAIAQQAAVYMIAVSDKAIAPLVQQLHLPGKLVLHTAGSAGIESLAGISEQYGVLYPVQSIRKEMEAATPIPFLVDGNNETVTTAIEQFALSLGSQVARGNDLVRGKLHVAAVFACNFVNYMYLQSAGFCESENIDFTLLQPLIEETALRLRQYHPSQVFTGPAVRKDLATIDRHLQLLQPYPLQYELYNILTAGILQNA
jgi:predicted short-subunit dehydrogenase-like oxidoreductase (DUF2520 family)